MTAEISGLDGARRVHTVTYGDVAWMVHSKTSIHLLMQLISPMPLTLHFHFKLWIPSSKMCCFKKIFPLNPEAMSSPFQWSLLNTCSSRAHPHWIDLARARNEVDLLLSRFCSRQSADELSWHIRLKLWGHTTDCITFNLSIDLVKAHLKKSFVIWYKWMIEWPIKDTLKGDCDIVNSGWTNTCEVQWSLLWTPISSKSIK